MPAEAQARGRLLASSALCNTNPIQVTAEVTRGPGVSFRLHGYYPF